MGANIATSFILFFLVVPVAVYGAIYTLPWEILVDSSQFASKKIRVGDSIVFVYREPHSVYVVNEESYNNCSTSGASFSDKSGSTLYKLTKEGPAYFICGNPGHCGMGMRLQLNVTGSTSKNGANWLLFFGFSLILGALMA